MIDIKEEEKSDSHYKSFNTSSFYSYFDEDNIEAAPGDNHRDNSLDLKRRIDKLNTDINQVIFKINSLDRKYEGKLEKLERVLNWNEYTNIKEEINEDNIEGFIELSNSEDYTEDK